MYLLYIKRNYEGKFLLVLMLLFSWSFSTRAQVPATLYYDNENGQINFLESAAGHLVKHYPDASTGTQPGDITLFEGVRTITNGTVIDCIVKTVSVTNVDTWEAFDENRVSLTTPVFFDNNAPNYFSPQIYFLAGGGNVQFEFQFILGGSFDTGTLKGTNVTLQNVKLNTYDLDGNGFAGSFQYNKFTGFNSSQLSSDQGSATRVTATYDASTGLTAFTANQTVNLNPITDPRTRVLVSNNNVSKFTLIAGSYGDGISLFFLDFSSGADFISLTTSAPAIDLNTVTIGVDNVETSCDSEIPFSKSSQTNVPVANQLLVSLDVTYPFSAILDGDNEKLLINGADAGTSSYDLNFTSADVATVVSIGGVVFNVTKTVSTISGVVLNKISFASSTTFTKSQAELLLDALRYTNLATSPSQGKRNFVLNLRDARFKSPDAIFSVSLPCTPLPVTLTYFDVSRENEMTLISWSTTEEVNSDYFEVQHSMDAKIWNKLETISAHGDSKAVQHYQVTDNLPFANANYYRLKMVDRDAWYAFSRIRMMNFDKENLTKIFPNPVSEILNIETADWESVSGIEIYNTTGQKVYSNIGKNLRNTINIRSFSPGTYVVKLLKNSEEFYNTKILIYR